MAGFNAIELKRGIKNCEKNIAIFEKAIKQEKATQVYFRYLIKEAKRMEEKRELVSRSMGRIAGTWIFLFNRTDDPGNSSRIKYFPV